MYAGKFNFLYRMAFKSLLDMHKDMVGIEGDGSCAIEEICLAWHCVWHRHWPYPVLHCSFEWSNMVGRYLWWQHDTAFSNAAQEIMM